MMNPTYFTNTGADDHKMNQSRPFRKPPDVEEALSSMLWTPYDNNASDTDSSLDDSNDGSPGDLGSGSSFSHHHHHHIQNNNNYLPSSSAALKRSFSEWNYRSKPGVGHNRYSYPYGGYSGTTMVALPLDPAANSSVNGYWNSNNIYSNGSYSGPASAGFFPPYLDWKDRPLVPLLPFSLLGVETAVTPGGGGRMTGSAVPAPGAIGFGTSFYENDLLNSNMMLGVNDSSSSSFADYQVYPSTGSYLSPTAPPPLQPPSSSQRQFTSSSSSWSSSAASGYNPNSDGGGYDNNNSSSLCRISAMLKPVMRGHSGNVGDLHFSKHQQRPPNHSMLENATGSAGSTTTTMDGAAADGRIRRSRSSADEWMKRNEHREPFNGYQYQYGGGGAEFIAEEEGGCEGAVEQAAVDGRAAIRAASAAASDRDGFSSVRIVNGEAYASDLVDTASSSSSSESRYRCRSAFVDSVRDYSDSGNSSRVRALQQNLRGFGRSVRDRFVRDIMRLNVPAAPEGGSRTSVYIPSAEGTATTVESAVSLLSEGGQPRPTLTIQVNRVDTNNQEQNDVVNNASSGVSIVNCYRRETPLKSDQENVVPNGQDRPQECQFYPSDVNSATTIVDKNLVNISANAEQMVHVSNTVVQSGSSDPVDHNQKNPIPQTMPQTDIDRIEPAATTNPNRTYTSTEAQTDLLEPSPYPTPTPYPTHHPPPPLLLSPPGSEFSTREHRRRERRERRQARNRLAHIHPIDPHGPPPPIRHQPPPPPPPIELIPDILHSHLPPPYTTLPMGASAAAVLHHPGPMLAAPIGAHHPAAVAVAAVHHRGAAAGVVGATEDCRYTFPIPIMRSSPSERSRKGCCGHWFAGPPLRALIAVVALGGVACALGGAALGATGLAGSPTSHLTAALLMIGVGVILVTVSGAAWRMTAPGAPPCLGLGSTVDLGRCSRRPCGRGGSTPHGLLYPEFQHRPPPPSYQASMQEYRLRLLLLDRDRQSGRMRSTASPPPTYRSNVGSLLRIPLTSRYNSSSNNNATTGNNPATGGSTTSLFGGISGIINGAMGSSTNSLNGSTSPDQHLHLQLHPDPSGGGAPPPTYRTIDRRSSSGTPDPDQQDQKSDDNAGTIATTTSPPPPPTSVIKIDDSKSTPAAGGDHNVAGAGTGSAAVVLKHKQRNSITHDSIEADSGSSIKPDKPNQDLVTIVTISGTQRSSGSEEGALPPGKDGPL